ncbi:MAG: hypothetical protein G3M78_12280 [Candidatus Nitrohelix vancouverensis]|uniref:Uncharacterized protein n=1 Tax=Candidatus Nitrohelix vancouverensis TaxID=2705534 RepID=A0A7T0C450_9BACT|nr:MAG: hypothetical protein G3M78_12280 [Candidatus Nitrohelix vancouverensis]
MYIEKDDQYAVECQLKIAPDCIKTGEFCETNEDAVEWVEEECWIYSGEGWICTQCNLQIFQNIGDLKRRQRLPKD